MEFHARSRTARLRAFGQARHLDGCRLLPPLCKARMSRCLFFNIMRHAKAQQIAPCSVAEKQTSLPFWPCPKLFHYSLAAAHIGSFMLSGQANASSLLQIQPHVCTDAAPQQQLPSQTDYGGFYACSLSSPALTDITCPPHGDTVQQLVANPLADVAEVHQARTHGHMQAMQANLRPPGVLHLPLMSLSARGGGDVWVQLGAIVAANIIGVQAVMAVMRRFADRSEPLTLVRLQFGLVQPATGAAMLGKAGSMANLRTRLAQLAGMIQMGQHGLWLIVEEAVLELSHHQQAAALADVQVVHLTSKEKAYALLGRVAREESSKARAEDASAHAAGQGSCVPDWDSDMARQSQQDRPALLQWLTGKSGHLESSCDDALVVTLVVTARGHLDMPSSVHTWHDACHVMKGLCGLSSSQLMGVDLTWAPARDGTFLTREELERDYANLKPIKH